MNRIVSSVIFVGAVALASQSMAADLTPTEPMVMDAPALVHDWSGVYAGAVLGYTSADSDTTYDNPSYSSFDVTSSSEGYSFGVTAGANFVLSGPLVIGIEGDLSATDISSTFVDTLGSYPSASGETITTKTDYAGTLRGRVGFALDNWLPYATAGLAVSHATVSATDGNIEDSGTLYGLVAGVGVEVAVTDSISLKTEYLRTQTQDHTWFEGESYSSTGSTSSDTVRVGLNFRF